MKKILELILKHLARAILAKYRPKVIGITGSVGKTSTKEAIFAVLKNKFRVRRNIKNYNNEIGLPLTIIGRHSGGRNIFRWLEIFYHALSLIVLTNKKYPEILVLEMGVDRINDMDYLLSIVTPNVSVITAIGPSHLEHFGSLENILAEKSKILRPLQHSDWAILNQDDEVVAGLIEHCRCQVRTYGVKDNAQVKLSDIDFIKQQDTYGTAFKLSFNNEQSEIFLPNILGRQHAVALAAAVAVASVYNLSWSEIISQFKNYKPALGRTNLLPGIKHSWIIDDTYNSAPQSAEVALEILAKLPNSGHKVAVLGDMLELGKISEKAHQEIGQLVAKLGIDYLYVVGERSRDIAKGAKEAGLSEDRIYHFPFTAEAGLFLQDRLKDNDLVLVKGSQGMRMEKVVYEIMASPWEAKELLVRQDGEWSKK